MPTKEEIKQAALGFMHETPPIKLQAYVESLSNDEKEDFNQWMAHFAQRAAFINEYVTARLAHDHHDHDKAVDMANRIHTAIRKVMGFAVPKSDIRI